MIEFHLKQVAAAHGHTFDTAVQESADGPVDERAEIAVIGSLFPKIDFPYC